MQYFLNDLKLINAKYLCVSSYTDEDMAMTKGGKGLVKIDENLDFITQSMRGELISFLVGIARSATDDSNTPLEAPNSSDKSHISLMGTNIDIIFEMANEHLSLSQNDLALQA